jgi:hypothetical protein
MATKFFQSPSNTPPPSNGDWNFLVAQEGMGGMNFISKMILDAPPLFLAAKTF